MIGDDEGLRTWAGELQRVIDKPNERCIGGGRSLQYSVKKGAFIGKEGGSAMRMEISRKAPRKSAK